MNVHFSSKTDQWATPQDFFDELHKEFGFTLDPCADKSNAKCAKYYTHEDDGLSKDWSGERVFCNPPYGREIGKWIKKAHDSNALVVMLIPARTDTKAWHEYIFGKAEVRFVKGRLKFGDSKNSAPFPSAVVIFRERNTRRPTLEELNDYSFGHLDYNPFETGPERTSIQALR